MFFLSLPASRRDTWLGSGPPHLQPRPLQPFSYHVILTLTLQLRNLVMNWAYLDNTGAFPCFKVSWLRTIILSAHWIPIYHLIWQSPRFWGLERRHLLVGGTLPTTSFCCIRNYRLEWIRKNRRDNHFFKITYSKSVVGTLLFKILPLRKKLFSWLWNKNNWNTRVDYFQRY